MAFPDQAVIDVAVFGLFGAIGDLARRMVLPAFYRLASERLLPRQWLLAGNGRGEMTHEHAASGLPMPPATYPVAIPKGAQNQRIWPFVTACKSSGHTHTESALGIGC